jgi:hypothetical protein
VRRVAFVIAMLLLFVACGTEKVDRARWQAMSADQRTLYVNSMLGAEQVQNSKGGAARTHKQPSQHYVEAIDRAYAAGDARNPDEIFASLRD